jgi:hypothetical protein
VVKRQAKDYVWLLSFRVKFLFDDMQLHLRIHDRISHHLLELVAHWPFKFKSSSPLASQANVAVQDTPKKKVKLLSYVTEELDGHTQKGSQAAVLCERRNQLII